jgi:hypothetical protein
MERKLKGHRERRGEKLEKWNIGILECWAREIKCLNPLFHHSIIPIHLPCGLWERKFFSFF